MNWLRRFMAGRYGGDQLSVALMVLSLIFMVIASVTHLTAIAFLSFIPIVLCFLRIYSRNIYKRQAENRKFMTLLQPVTSWFRLGARRIRDRKTHRYIRCPQCGAQLRLPRGKGKIRITCTKCQNKFMGKT